jgi:hypothetical protein
VALISGVSLCCLCEVDVDAGNAKQLLNKGSVASEDGAKERRLAFGTWHIDVDTGSTQQQFRNRVMGVEDSFEQGCLPL